MELSDKIDRPLRSPLDLSKEELESCIDGSYNVDGIVEILNKTGVIDNYGWIDPEIFADWFSTSLEDLIPEEEDTPEWTEAFDNNWNWGYEIGDNINSLISNNFKETRNA